MLIKGIDYPEPLLRAQLAGELVIFAGAGVSNPPPSSLPLFSGLAKRIGSGSGVDKDDAEPEDRYLGRLKKRGIHVHEAAARILVNDETKPHTLHELLVQFAPSGGRLRIVTTNFDTHFSTTATAIFGDGFETFCAPALPLGDDFTGLVYLHGCAGKDPKRCVVTDEDFGRAYLTQSWASRFLAAMFSRYTVIFVGYSHNDFVMNYLARGLPPVSQKPRFAFTTDDSESLAKWEFLGIQPLTYKKVSGNNPHQAITDSVKEWVNELGRGLLEKAERIRGIAESEPPLEGEDSDYIKFSLSSTETARLFFKYAKLPGWISWLEKQQLLPPVFDPRVTFNDFHRDLAFWLAEKFFAEHAGELMAAIQRNGGKIHPELCWLFWRRLCMRGRDASIDPVFSKWVAVLLSQPHDVLRSDDWGALLHYCRLPGDKTASLLLFDRISQPRALLRERWRLLDEADDDPQSVDFDLTILRDSEHTAHQVWDLFRTNLANYAMELEPIVTTNLMAAHGLMEICGRARLNYDPFRVHRQSIEQHPQDGSSTMLDVLVDAGRDILGHQLQTRPNHAAALIEKWFSLEAALLKRIAIHGFARRTDVNDDGKLNWLLQNRLLYLFKTDVFCFLKQCFPSASEPTKREVLDAALQGPIREGLEEPTREYEKFNLLVWLHRCAPACEITAEKLEQVRRANPDFGERDEPELDFWSGGVQTIEPTAGFNLDEVATRPAQEFLTELLAWRPRNPMDKSRGNYCSVASAVIARNPEWGIAWANELVSQALNDSDLWEYLCQGWRNANPTSAQWLSILELAETVNAPAAFFSAFTEVLEHGSRKEQSALPVEQMPLAQRVAERIWITALAQTAPEVGGREDWLTVAINRPGGRLARFWLQRISVERKNAGENWRGLPSAISESVAEILKSRCGAAVHARVVFASQLHYLLSLDQSFALNNLLPMFNWETDALRAEQCWHGFLVWGRWFPDLKDHLLPHLDGTIRRITELPKDVRERVADHVAGLTLILMADPLADNWLPNVLLQFQKEDRERLARHFDQVLGKVATEVAEGIWERWFKRYWEMRLLGTPNPLLPTEANELVFCSLSFGRYFPDAVQLAIRMGDQVRLEHTDLLYRIDKKGLAASYPAATGDLVLFFFRSKPQHFYASDFVANVWRELQSSSVSRNLLRQIREAMFALGHDPDRSEPLQ